MCFKNLINNRAKKQSLFDIENSGTKTINKLNQKAKGNINNTNTFVTEVKKFDKVFYKEDWENDKTNNRYVLKISKSSHSLENPFASFVMTNKNGKWEVVFCDVEFDDKGNVIIASSEKQDRIRIVII